MLYLTKTCSNAKGDQCVYVEPSHNGRRQGQQCRQQSYRSTEPANADVVRQLTTIKVGGNVSVVKTTQNVPLQCLTPEELTDQ